MSWLGFDDGYTRQPVWDGLSYDARWHFHALVEYCGATRRYSGRMGLADALRCSDVPDPGRCMRDLFAAGLVVNMGAQAEVADVDNYLPPEGQRDESLLPRKRANQAAYRKRRCESGRHDRNCPALTCPVKLARAAERVTERVTGNAGSGRDGAGSSSKTEGQELQQPASRPDIRPAEGAPRSEHEVREREARDLASPAMSRPAQPAHNPPSPSQSDEPTTTPRTPLPPAIQTRRSGGPCPATLSIPPDLGSPSTMVAMRPP